MSDVERRKVLVELEADFRRAETALAIAKADFEKAYTAMLGYMNEQENGRRHVLAFSPDVTLH